MMNMRNLGSKGSTGVKFKDSIYAKLWLKLCFESLLDLRVYSLHIRRNHSNTILLINLQKTKTCPKQNIAARAISSDIVMKV